MMAGKIKFDQEAAFKSIIGVSAGAPAAEEKKAVEAPAARPTGKGRPKADRETKKRVILALFPSTYGDLQKIAYMKRQSASDLISELIAGYVAANGELLEEYRKLKGE